MTYVIYQIFDKDSNEMIAETADYNTMVEYRENGFTVKIKYMETVKRD